MLHKKKESRREEKQERFRRILIPIGSRIECRSIERTRETETLPLIQIHDLATTTAENQVRLLFFIPFLPLLFFMYICIQTDSGIVVR